MVHGMKWFFGVVRHGIGVHKLLHFLWKELRASNIEKYLFFCQHKRQLKMIFVFILLAFLYSHVRMTRSVIINGNS